MTGLDAGSTVQDNYFSIEIASASARIPLRYATHSHDQASSSTFVLAKIRIHVSRTGLAPVSTRIPQPNLVRRCLSSTQ